MSMTLTEIISTTLSRLGRNSGSTSKYEETFKLYANDAIRQIAEKFKACRSESVDLVDGEFDLSDLSHEAFSIVKVLDTEGNQLTFELVEDGAGEMTKISVDTEETSVNVVYQFVPKQLVNSQDKPEIPDRYQHMIVYWIAACERSNGDPDTMSGAASDFQLFAKALSTVRPATLGVSSSHLLQNY